MASYLSIRNFTPTPLLLQSFESFEDPHSGQSKAFAFAGLDNTSPGPSVLQLGKYAESFKQRDLDVWLAPLEAFVIVLDQNQSALQVEFPRTLAVRIIVSNSAGDRYRMIVNPSYTQKSSQLVRPLNSSPTSSALTALSHPSLPIAFLTFHQNHLINYRKWMQTLPSSAPLSALSVPGTHNSHTYYRALPSVRCQLHDLRTQLEHGIRFFDIRLQPASSTDIANKDLYLVHGAFPISLMGPKYLAPLLETCYAFLEENVSETIIMSLKREGVGSATDGHIARVLERHYFSTKPERWWLQPRIPYLGEVRGKIVLLRRYEVDVPTTTPSHPAPPSSRLSPSASPLHLPHASSSTASPRSTTTTSTLPPASAPPGLPATHWPFSPSHSLTPLLSTQDFCDICSPALIPLKLSHVLAHLVRSATATSTPPIPGITTDSRHPVPPGNLFLNFLSGSNFFRRGTWPERVAGSVNSAVEVWLCGDHGLEEVLVPTLSAEGQGTVEGKARHEEGTTVKTGVRRRKYMGDGGTGVVVMDRVGEGGSWDLVEMVIGMNIVIMLVVREAERLTAAGEGEMETRET